jgi:hypothetical protein
MEQWLVETRQRLLCELVRSVVAPQLDQDERERERDVANIWLHSTRLLPGEIENE